jgi:hypothetical protein
VLQGGNNPGLNTSTSPSPFDDLLGNKYGNIAGLPPIEHSPPPSPSPTTESYGMIPTPEPVSSENVRTLLELPDKAVLKFWDPIDSKSSG